MLITILSFEAHSEQKFSLVVLPSPSYHIKVCQTNSVDFTTLNLIRFANQCNHQSVAYSISITGLSVAVHSYFHSPPVE